MLLHILQKNKMGWQILDPSPLNELPSEDLRRRSIKREREQLDLRAEQQRKGWRTVQLIAQNMFGKTKNFSLSECKQIMRIIKNENR